MKYKEDKIPKYIRCYDNYGETFDRYTVVFTKKKGYLYAAYSTNPFSPMGFWQHGQGNYQPIDRPNYAHLGRKVSFDSLPKDVQNAVMQDYRAIWE